MSLVVGVDAGATTTRCVVATAGGQVVGRGVAGGANRNSSRSDLVGTLGAALGGALRGQDPSSVRVAVLGAAGSSGAGRESFRHAAVAACSGAGLAATEVVTVTDLEVAFAAGTASPGGALLLSGTGALAARFAGGVLAHRCDGYGWLLGDEGSAVWIGVRALRAVLAALDGRAGGGTTLVGAACAVLGIDGRDGTAEDLAQAVVAEGFRRPPAELGLLAPAVSAAAEAGDEVARGICDAAAAKLLHTFEAVGRPPGGAVVLAGSVLLSPGPVGRAVRDGLRRRGVDAPAEARDGAAGAAALAVARLTGTPADAAVHARLTGHDPSRE